MKKGAVFCTLALVLLFAVVLVVLLFTAPLLVECYAVWRALPPGEDTALLVSFYLCALPSGISLLCLYRLLQNIRKDRIFTQPSSLLMSIVSWCCAAVTLITGVAGFWYMPLFFLTVAMAFLFLIVRVIRGCFIAAIALKEENSLTI